MSTDFERAQLWSCDRIFFFPGLFGWITKAGASCLSDRPTTCSLMWSGRFSLEDYFPDQAVSPNTDILSTGRPKLSYSPRLWHSRLFSLTMEPRNVTPWPVLCEINRWCSVLIRLCFEPEANIHSRTCLRLLLSDLLGVSVCVNVYVFKIN